MTAVNMVGKNPNFELIEREKSWWERGERGKGMGGGSWWRGAGGGAGVGEGMGRGVGGGRDKTGQDKISVL